MSSKSHSERKSPLPPSLPSPSRGAESSQPHHQESLQAQAQAQKEGKRQKQKQQSLEQKEFKKLLKKERIEVAKSGIVDEMIWGSSMNIEAATGLRNFLQFFCPKDLIPKYGNVVVPFIQRLGRLKDSLPFDPNTIVLQPGETIDMKRADAAILLAAGLMLELNRNYFDFTRFLSAVDSRSGSQGGKMRCMLHYFDVVRDRYIQKNDGNDADINYARLQEAMQGNILFQSRILSEAVEATPWASSMKPLCKVIVDERGTIEDDGKNSIQADFANKKIGGGVLRLGCVQEEIRFVINPECLVSLLLKDGPMKPLESVMILGVERFSNYRGYAGSFRFAGPHVDDVEVIEYNGNKYINTNIVAIDAMPRVYLEDQFAEANFRRELHKALSGYTINEWERHTRVMPVATGNWGCGAFGGCIQVKSLVQWISCSIADRPLMQYYTFKDAKAAGTAEIMQAISEAGWTVGELYSSIMSYDARKWVQSTLYDFLASKLKK